MGTTLEWCSFCRTILSPVNWYQHVALHSGCGDGFQCCDDCFRRMSKQFHLTDWYCSDDSHVKSLALDAIIFRGDEEGNKTRAKLSAHREAVKTAWREEESLSVTGRLEKIKALEDKMALEPKSWISHYALAEYLDKCWSRYADLDHEVCLTYGEREAYAEYWDFRRKACEEYFKAAALGIVHPLYSALAKLRYAILLGQSGWPYLWEPKCEYSHIGPIQVRVIMSTDSPPIDFRHETGERIRHYAREAEKDLRKYLREYPDNIAALRKLAQALALSQEGRGVRSERLMAIDARIEEAEIRRQMSVAPSSQLGAPGAPESPYPDNWKQLSEAAKHRDGHKCADCGATGVELHVHHIVPLSKGGTNDLDNLATLCSMCHSMIHPRMGDTP